MLHVGPFNIATTLYPAAQLLTLRPPVPVAVLVPVSMVFSCARAAGAAGAECRACLMRANVCLDCCRNRLRLTSSVGVMCENIRGFCSTRSTDRVSSFAIFSAMFSFFCRSAWALLKSLMFALLFLVRTSISQLSNMLCMYEEATHQSKSRFAGKYSVFSLGALIPRKQTHPDTPSTIKRISRRHVGVMHPCAVCAVCAACNDTCLQLLNPGSKLVLDEEVWVIVLQRTVRLHARLVKPTRLL